MAARERWREQVQLKVAAAATTGKIWQRHLPPSLARCRQACLAAPAAPRWCRLLPRSRGEVEELRPPAVEEPHSPQPRVRDWRSDAVTEWGLGRHERRRQCPRAGCSSPWPLLARGPTTTGQRFASPRLDDVYLHLNSSGRQNRCCI
jgi:hypothetical protein